MVATSQSDYNDSAPLHPPLPLPLLPRNRFHLPAVSLQRPHTIRLLKLIRDGSADYAEPAIVQLEATTVGDVSHTMTAPPSASSSLSSSSLSRHQSQYSPLQLWDLIGRLASVCLASSWPTRTMGSLALQAMARHVPRGDQERFLHERNDRIEGQRPAKTTTNSNGTESKIAASSTTATSTSTFDSSLFLRVANLLEGGGLDAVLQQGQALFAMAPSKYVSSANNRDDWDDDDDDDNDEDDVQLRNVEHDIEDDDSKPRRSSYVQARAQLQRSILARRLGLAALVSVTSQSGGCRRGSGANHHHHHTDDPTEQLLDETMADEEEDNTLVHPGNSKKRPRYHDHHSIAVSEVDDAVALEPSNNPHSLRALLVLQCSRHEQQQQQQQDDVSPGCDANQNPQTLLATELIYRMMDPQWHVRHGAALGILALLRAWSQAQPLALPQPPPHEKSSTPDSTPIVETTDADIDTDTSSRSTFGSWPEDILTRCLCVLALDRFGDFSSGALDVTASALSADADSASLSTSVVAPVREVVAQIVAVLWAMLVRTRPMDETTIGTTTNESTDSSIASDTLAVLYRLCCDESTWEVRHGALLALKYIVVTTTEGFGGSVDVLAPAKVFPFSACCSSGGGVISSIASVASNLLSDKSDDVKSVAAQVLIEIGRRSIGSVVNGTGADETSILPDYLSTAIPPLWNQVHKVRTMSSCIVDLVALLAMFIQTDASSFLQRLPTVSLLEITESVDDQPHDENLSGQLDKVIDVLLRLFDADSPSVRTAALRSIGALCTRTGSIASNTSSQHDLSPSFLLLVEKTFELYFHPRNDSRQQAGEHAAFVPRALLDEVWKLVCDACVLVALSMNVNREATSDMHHVLAQLDCRLLCRFFEIESDRWTETRDLSGHLAAADALSYILCRSTGEKCLHCVTQTALVALFNSPWAWQVEASCLLYRALKVRGVGGTSSLEPFEMLLDPDALLPCLDEQRGFDETSGAYHSAVLRALNDAASGVMASFDIHQLLSKLSPVFACSSQQRTVAPVTAMRVRTSIAGAVLSKGLPSKVTPLVRSLMTSFNNEAVTNTFTIELGIYLRQLLEAMSQDEKYDRGYNKVVDTLCDAAIQNSEMVQPWCPRQHVAISVLQSLMQSNSSGRQLADIPSLQRRLNHLLITTTNTPECVLESSCALLEVLTGGLDRNSSRASTLINDYVPTLVELSCSEDRGHRVRQLASSCLEALCGVHSRHLLHVAIPLLTHKISHSIEEDTKTATCAVLETLIQVSGTSISCYVRCLLPLVLSLVTSSVPMCAHRANYMFAALVRVAPLVGKINPSVRTVSPDQRSDSVIDHLIYGNPLPVHEFPIGIGLEQIKLRNYQKEGIAWLQFLRSTSLSGALCDDMGLGKSIQALVAVALAHHESAASCQASRPVSLVICPASLVGHWKGEIEKHFPASSVFRVLCLVGSRSERQSLWSSRSPNVNLVIASYGVLRYDVGYLESVIWCYCILDEGHLLKNPKTATAQASRRLKSRSKLILTGTPIQNRVYELWATFDFLMPNFLGTSTKFTKDFANPITKSQLPCASASNIAVGIAKLKLLHQQVLPFILRREKEQVLPELPATTLTVVRVQMSGIQQNIYNRFRAQEEGNRCLDMLGDVMKEPSRLHPTMNADVLKSLLFLRLVCTHPSLVLSTSQLDSLPESLLTIGSSGKLLALSHLLKEAGIYDDDLTGADNDTSLLYCDDESEDEDVMSMLLESPEQYNGNLLSARSSPSSSRKCLVFAQFSKSLDAVEEYLFKAHMPSLKYFRIDGTVPPDKRTKLVARFAVDPTVRVMLLTTRVGGLGLNLTAASLVIFLELDLNPFADIQAQDRCRRIGQTQQVDVYRLVTKDSIEESILVLQDKKKRLADSVVNTENSTMFSMGTDRLLDIFSLPGSHEKESCDTTGLRFDLDGFVERCSEDYKSLSVTKFTESFVR